MDGEASDDWFRATSRQPGPGRPDFYLLSRSAADRLASHPLFANREITPITADEGRQALAEVESQMPDEVRDAVQWLESAGWELRGFAGPDRVSFGNLIVYLSDGARHIRVILDRSHWELYILMPEWSDYLGIWLIDDTRRDRQTWAPFGQLTTADDFCAPEYWAERLPHVLDWLTHTSDTEAKVRAVAAERYRQVFPGHTGSRTTRRLPPIESERPDKTRTPWRL